ncbi:protein of unknown function [Burkholderia multivorans]
MLINKPHLPARLISKWNRLDTHWKLQLKRIATYSGLLVMKLTMHFVIGALAVCGGLTACWLAWTGGLPR